MSDGRPFSELGLAYAKRFADIEGARKQFMAERDDCLRRLREPLLKALGESASEFAMSPVKDDADALFATHLQSKYSAARKRIGKPGAAGVQLELVSLETLQHRGAFGFAATAWFGMGKPQYRRLCKALGGLDTRTHSLEDNYLYVCETVIPLDDEAPAFTEQNMVASIAPTLALYFSLDKTFAERVELDANNARGDEDDEDASGQP